MGISLQGRIPFARKQVFLLPSAGFLATGKKNGTITSLALFGILVILLWTPIGEIALRYNYTLTFKMRLPFLYLVFFVVGYLVETIRAKLSDQIDELKEKYEHLSKIGSLTDIENRYSFNIDLEDAIKHSNKCSTLGLLILDIDYFKKVNDVFGHVAGDMVLIEIANVLKAICNENDGIACRWGGEEFTALFFNITKDELLQKAETVRSQVESMTIPFGEATIHVTVSVGATCMEVCNVKDCDLFVTIADKGLYQAKENGRNQVCYLQDKQNI